MFCVVPCRSLPEPVQSWTRQALISPHCWLNAQLPHFAFAPICTSEAKILLSAPCPSHRPPNADRPERVRRLHCHRLRPGDAASRDYPMAVPRQPDPPQGAKARRHHGRRRTQRACLHDLPRRSIGQSCIRSTRSSASTARSNAGPRSSVSSPTMPPSSAWSARSCSSRTMNGPCSAPDT